LTSSNICTGEYLTNALRRISITATLDVFAFTPERENDEAAIHRCTFQ
jgi:hypothetical protein